MPKVAVITDSTAGLPKELATEYSIQVTPQILLWGSETYYDGVNIQPDEFYQKLAKASVMPASSQASPATFEKMFREQLDLGNDVLAVVVSARLSGTYNSAIQAQEAIGSDRIAVVDTNTTSMAMGFVAMQAARLSAQGASLADCKEEAEYSSRNTGVVLTVDTLEFLHRGGRIGGATRFLGTALNIKPILELQDGRIEPIERVRTRAKALPRLLDLLEERTQGKPIRLGVLHANVEEDARKILETANGRFHILESLIAPVSPVVGTHVGPGTIGLAWMTES